MTLDCLSCFYGGGGGGKVRAIVVRVAHGEPRTEDMQDRGTEVVHAVLPSLLVPVASRVRGASGQWMSHQHA